MNRPSLMSPAGSPNAPEGAGANVSTTSIPGAKGIANPRSRVHRTFRRSQHSICIARQVEVVDDDEQSSWLLNLTEDIRSAATVGVPPVDASNAQHCDDVRTLDRWLDSLGVSEASKAYARIRLFTVRYDIPWLIVTAGCSAASACNRTLKES